MALAKALQSLLLQDNQLSESIAIVKKLYFLNKFEIKDKSEVIINWFFECIKKNIRLTNECLLLWSSLHEILKHEEHKSHNISIRSNWFDIIRSALCTSPVTAIFKCVLTFLQCPSVKAMVSTNIDISVYLLFDVIKAVCTKYLESSLSHENVMESKRLMVTLMDWNDNLSHSENDSKVSALTVSLWEVGMLALISEQKKEFCEVKKRLMEYICCIFFHSQMKPYEAFLNLCQEPGVKQENVNIKDFFVQVHKLLQQHDQADPFRQETISVSSLLKSIVDHLLQRNEDEKFDSEPLKVLALFSAMAGLDIPLVVTAESCCSRSFKYGHRQPVNLPILNGILESCAKHPQYFASASVPEGILKPSDWLQGATAFLLDLKSIKPKSLWLKCFRSLIQASVPVVENNITYIIKSCLFNTNVHNADSKQEYCELFKDMLNMHYRMHQLPKFFVKLLLSLTECINQNSVGKFISRGQVVSKVLQAMSFYFSELSFGQILELWNIFAETFAIFVEMCQKYENAKGAVFFISQIFAAFLLHAKVFEESIPENVQMKFHELITLSFSELKKISFIKTETDSVEQYLQRSLLLLYCDLSQLSMELKNSEIRDSADVVPSQNPFDFSVLCSSLNAEFSETFQSYLTGDDKTLSYLVVQLLVLKIRILISQSQVEAVNPDLLTSFSFLLSHAQENISLSANWDSDLYTIDSTNYGSAVWTLLLKHLPIVMSHIDVKEVMRLGQCLTEIVLQNTDGSDFEGSTTLKSIVLSALKTDIYQNCWTLQSALIASIWNVNGDVLNRKRSSTELENEMDYGTILSQLSSFRSKWLKYFDTTPKKSSEELNPLWESLRNICMTFNQVLEMKAPKPKLKIHFFYRVLELLENAPIAYLTPPNQLRCMLGLSLLLVLIPESCSGEESLDLAQKVCRQMVIGLEGVRSVWLFDFVSCGLYLEEVVNAIQGIADRNPGENLEWSQTLFEQLIVQIVKNGPALSKAQNYFNQLFVDKNKTETSVILLSLLMKPLNKILRREHLPLFKDELEELGKSVCSFCVNLLKKSEGNDDSAAYRMLVECYVEVIEFLSLPSVTVDPKKRSKYLQRLPHLIEVGKRSLLNQDCNQKTFLMFFTRICKSFGSIPTDEELGITGSMLWDAISVHISHKHSSGVKHSFEQTFDKSENELLQSLFAILSEDEMKQILEDVLQNMERSNPDVLSSNRLKVYMDILKNIIEFDIKKPEQILSREIVGKIILNCLDIVGKSNHSVEHLRTIKIPILQFVVFLVKMAKTPLPRACIMQCFHFCMTIRLSSVLHDIPTFVEAFQAQFDFVYYLLLIHPQWVVVAPAVLNNVASNLLKHLVLCSSQETFNASDASTQEKLRFCANNIEKLFALMSKNKLELSKVVPYLIADYADSVQHITLEPTSKAHFISGVNCLLNICSENAIKMLSVNINRSCRDILDSVLRNYEKHRYRGEN